jgi:predicted AlkP superfamily phosphohydrolase/phosphomutase
MTGKNPGKHGIYAFNRYVLSETPQSLPADRRSIASETFFEIVSRHGHTVGAAHIPLSFPPAAVNGFWISGMVIPKGASYTYPAGLQAMLETRVGASFAERVGWALLDYEWDRVFDRTDTITQAQIGGLFYLLDKHAWDLFTYVFVSPDRLQHIAMCLLDETHPQYDAELARRYLPRVHEHFALLDRALGEVLERVDENTLLLLISDHGFRSCWHGWSAAAWLRQRSYLKYRRQWDGLAHMLQAQLQHVVRSPEKRARMRRLLNKLLVGGVDWSRTTAYVAANLEQGIRINLRGREPFGIVPAGEYEALREKLRGEIRALRDPASGQPLVEEVYLREELFQGAKLEEAPDLVFSYAPGVTGSSHSSGNGRYITPTGWKSGEHDMDGIFVAYGPGITAGQRVEQAQLIDIAPTVLHLMDVPIPEDIDGASLVTTLYGTTLAPAEQAPTQAREVGVSNYTPEEEQEILEHLRGLGYVD